ncbi:MAG TPA: chemotaxis protein CheX [Thermoanaerobaculia bacterium]|nr:chemotaxis protein CheX [Thermoanaerobaculia bacterium]
MSDEEIKVFIDGVVRYFEKVTGEPAQVDPPYLKGEDSVTLDFTGVIGISGRHRGAVYFTSGAEQLTDLLRRLGETEVGFSEHEDLVGEVANTIAGNARQYFGSEFLISVPIVLFGRPDKISFPRHLKSFVIPITWRSHRSYLIICLERAAADRDASGLSSRPGAIADLQP